MAKCECGNVATEYNGKCEWCDWADDQPPHKFRETLFGDLWCITCSSNYCELA